MLMQFQTYKKSQLSYNGYIVTEICIRCKKELYSGYWNSASVIQPEFFGNYFTV